jgi:hypothetical protein
MAVTSSSSLSAGIKVAKPPFFKMSGEEQSYTNEPYTLKGL